MTIHDHFITLFPEYGHEYIDGLTEALLSVLLETVREEKHWPLIIWRVLELCATSYCLGVIKAWVMKVEDKACPLAIMWEVEE
jgi:hypothetical protein